MNNKTVTKSVGLENRPKTALLPKIAVAFVKHRQQLTQSLARQQVVYSLA